MTRLRWTAWAVLSWWKTCFGPGGPSPQPIGGRGGDLAAAKNGATREGTHWRPEIWDNNHQAWPVADHASIQFSLMELQATGPGAPNDVHGGWDEEGVHEREFA